MQDANQWLSALAAQTPFGPAPATAPQTPMPPMERPAGYKPFTGFNTQVAKPGLSPGSAEKMKQLMLMQMQGVTGRWGKPVTTQLPWSQMIGTMKGPTP